MPDGTQKDGHRPYYHEGGRKLIYGLQRVPGQIEGLPRGFMPREVSAGEELHLEYPLPDGLLAAFWTRLVTTPAGWGDLDAWKQTDWRIAHNDPAASATYIYTLEQCMQASGTGMAWRRERLGGPGDRVSVVLESMRAQRLEAHAIAPELEGWTLCSVPPPPAPFPKAPE